MRKNMPSPPKTYKFSLKDFRVSFVHFEVNDKFTPVEGKTVDIATQIAFNQSYDKKKKELTLLMGLRQTNEDAPFTFELRGVGSFKFDRNPDEESLEKLSTINCPAIIFPYIREVVADLTRRGGFTPLHLAPINFVAMAEEKKKKLKTEKKAKYK